MQKSTIFILFCLFFISKNTFAQSNCPMTTGVNLFFNEYYAGEFPFANLMMQSSAKWTVRDIGSPEANEWASEKYHDSLAIDQNGYPLELPQSFKSQDEPQLVRNFLSLAALGPFPLGNYTLLYEGEGEIALHGGALDKVISQTQGKIVFTVKNQDLNQGFGIEIRKSKKGNHIKNVRVLLPNTEASFAQHPFNPQFLKQIEPLTCIRFLNWGGINGSKQVKWTDRNSPTYFTQSSSSKGAVAYEHMIQLCNLTKKDMWICVPHAADSNYVYQLATLLKNQLNPNLKIYVEYSNEVWNSIFEQHWYVKDNAPNNNWFHTHKYAYFSHKCFKNFEKVFKNDQKRIVRVLAGQHYNPWILEEAVKKIKELGGSFDAISCASYFSPQTLSGNLTVAQITDLTKKEIAANAKKFILQHTHLAKNNNAQLLMYESGPHMTRDQFGQNPPFEQALCQFHESQAMYDIYDNWLDFLRDTANVKLHNILGFQDDICTFGHIKDMWNNTPTLKMKAVLDNNCKPIVAVKNEAQNTDNQLIVFPNPSDGVINILIKTAAERNYQLSVFNLLGQKIMSQQINGTRLELDVHFLPQGKYILMLENEKERLIQKFIRM